MQALVLFGVPPEQYWPYTTSKFDSEPPAFTYAFADNYKAIQYYRLDYAGVTPDQLLTSIKTKLAAGLPSMFGFTVYSSISNSPDIPFPKRGDTILGGHAVMVAGFDDSHKIGSDVGALLIRNSWGTSWGNQGWGWLPYSYVLKGLAADFWSLAQASFVDTALFK
jgi:C1A family cysteine protease